jgi:hypothetical protein
MDPNSFQTYSNEEIAGFILDQINDIKKYTKGGTVSKPIPETKTVTVTIPKEVAPPR